jgi:hypothetical protein
MATGKMSDVPVFMAEVKRNESPRSQWQARKGVATTKNGGQGWVSVKCYAIGPACCARAAQDRMKDFLTIYIAEHGRVVPRSDFDGVIPLNTKG